MSIAREDLLVRLDTLSACLKESNLIDGTPNEYLRNQIAGLMRQGLAVLAFTALETFIRDRTSEALRSFDPSMVAFADLSDAIREAATIGATRAMLFRSKFEDSNNRLTWALNQIKTVATADTSLTTLSELSFGNDKANLDEDDIPQILKAFGVDKPWINLTIVAKRSGFGGILDAKQQFIEIKQRRHSSAHEIASSIPHADLSNSIQAIRGLAVGFDFLLSHAVAMHNLGRIPGRIPERKIEAKNINILYIEESLVSLNQFCVYRLLAATQTTPEIRVPLDIFQTKFESQVFAIQEANTNCEQIVEIGANGMIEDWHTW